MGGPMGWLKQDLDRQVRIYNSFYILFPVLT